MKQTKREQKYSLSLKEKIGRDYLSGQYSYGKLAEIYGLESRSVVREMVKWYKKKNNFAGNAINMDLSKEPEESVAISYEVGDLQTRIKELEKSLSESELRRASVEVLLDISISETGYDPRKKGGTKQ